MRQPLNLDWLRNKRTRFVAQALPSLLSFIIVLVSLANQVGYWAIVIALAGALFLWVVSNRLVERAAPEPTVIQVPNSPTTTTLYPVCSVGPHKVEAGDSRSILLNIKQGQRLKGHLVEVDSQPFDWYIADEKNMILLMNGERDDFQSIDEGYDRRAYRVNRKIPWQSRWFLILDAYGKQYSRKVRVDFEHIPSELKLS